MTFFNEEERNISWLIRIINMPTEEAEGEEIS